jgi:hypothetical protein
MVPRLNLNSTTVLPTPNRRMSTLPATLPVSVKRLRRPLSPGLTCDSSPHPCVAVLGTVVPVTERRRVAGHASRPVSHVEYNALAQPSIPTAHGDSPFQSKLQMELSEARREARAGHATNADLRVELQRMELKLESLEAVLAETPRATVPRKSSILIAASMDPDFEVPSVYAAIPRPSLPMSTVVPLRWGSVSAVPCAPAPSSSTSSPASSLSLSPSLSPVSAPLPPPALPRSDRADALERGLLDLLARVGVSVENHVGTRGVCITYACDRRLCRAGLDGRPGQLTVYACVGG